MKKCNVCKKELDENCFANNKSKKDGLQTFCKECRKVYDKKRYLNNKEYFNEASKKQKQRNVGWIINLKSKLKCETCGENFPYCLEFHHKDEKEKDGDISRMISDGYSIERIEKEIEKCIVLCANCHRKEHYKNVF